MSEKIKIIVDLCLTDPYYAKYYKYYWVIKNTFVPHNEKGPAYENHNGDTFWMRDGKYFRFDGDAEDIFGKTKKVKPIREKSLRKIPNDILDDEDDPIEGE